MQDTNMTQYWQGFFLGGNFEYSATTNTCPLKYLKSIYNSKIEGKKIAKYCVVKKYKWSTGVGVVYISDTIPHIF